MMLNASSFSTASSSSDSGSAEAPGDIRGFSRFQRLRSSAPLRFIGWFLIFLGFLLAFTALKFPETRVKTLVIGQVNSALAPRGISIDPETARIQFGMGFSLLMEGVQVSFPPPATPVRLDRLRIRPALLPLLFRKISARVELAVGDGSLELDLSLPMQTAPNSASPVAVNFEADELNLASVGLGSMAGGFSIYGVVSGEGEFAGDLSTPDTWQGETDFKINRLRTDARQIAGFQIPPLSISDLEAILRIEPETRKIRIETFRFGKSGSGDDLSGTLSGDATLSGRSPAQIPLAVTARFSLSDKLRRELVLLDAILGPGKQSDGSYAYKIGGTLGAPFPTPIPAAGASAGGAGGGP